MKRIKISIDDLLAVLEAMKENDTTEIIFFEHSGYPAIMDAEDNGQVISFQGVDENGELTDEDEQVH